MEEIRLQKFMAEAGIASRRKCEELILQERVKVNGKIASIGTKINPQKDEVILDGKKIIKLKHEKIYILLNKPIGYVTTAHDQFNRKTVLNLVNMEKRIVPVGRLDMYTSGALILSNDGDFIYKVTHPKHEITKTYLATVRGKIEEDSIKKLRNGIKIEDYVTKPAMVKIISYDTTSNTTQIEIIIHEGKNRQVRKMLEAIGKSTLRLERTKIGDIDVKNLDYGKWRYLSTEEVDKLID